MRLKMMFVSSMIGIFLLMTGTGMADQINLKNGDRMTGQVIRMQENQLVFKTDYAGEITIAWKEVLSVKTDRPIVVVLKDDTSLEGRSQAFEESKMQLDSDMLAAPASFQLSDVKAINPVKKKPVQWTARANVSLSNERGNTDTDNYYLDGEFIARTEENRYSISGKYNEEKSDGVTTAKSAVGYGKYDHFLNKQWFVFANTLFEHDEFKDLNLRSTIGAGAGYQFFETPLLNLSASAGLAWVDENFDLAQDNNYPAGQWSVNYDQYVFKRVMQLFHKQNGYISLKDSNDWFFKTQTGVRFPLYKGLTATFQFDYDYDNQPSAAAEKKEDTGFLLLLGYELAD